ncbi:MAG: enoyl-CoA hydratase/isomerase family protein [Ktedonobacteraceae bacterium]
MAHNHSTHYTQLIVTYALQDKIAIVTLHRPQVRNALNTQLIQELTDVFTELSINDRLHGVVLTGEGPTFCAGADIQMMRESITLNEAQNIEDALRLADMLHTINVFPCPVVARVQGDALGGGVGLVAVCDIVIAAESARFAFSEVKLGIAPAVISPYVIRKIGETSARALFVTGERFSAGRAHTLGLAHGVVPAEHLDDAVQKALKELVSNGPQALRASKALALNVGSMVHEHARHYTAEMIAHLRVSEEGQEGLSAFLEKRQPRWI